jgi:hypothetical protein
MAAPSGGALVTDVATVAQRGGEPARMTAKGLQLRAGITFDAWAGVGRRIAEISHASAWCLGDWLVYGQDSYGDRYKVALEATALDYQTLRNYAWVARRFTISRRRAALSLQHHAEVAALPDSAQDLWLSRAERFSWSRNELRRRVSSDRQVEHKAQPQSQACGRTVGITCRLRVTAERAHRWHEAAIASDQALPDWVVSVADAAANATLDSRPRNQTHPSSDPA